MATSVSVCEKMPFSTKSPKVKPVNGFRLSHIQTSIGGNEVKILTMQ